MFFDAEFQREQMTQGKLVPKSRDYECRWSSLTEGQRKHLCTLFFNPNSGIMIDKVVLGLPGKSTSSSHERNGFFSRNPIWKGKRNPDESTIETLLSDWEADCNAAGPQQSAGHG